LGDAQPLRGAAEMKFLSQYQQIPQLTELHDTILQ
jgi:hypothetical protein